MDLFDIIDEVKRLAWDGSIKSNIFEMLETSRESCTVWRQWKPMFGFDRTGVTTTASTQSGISRFRRHAA